MFVYNVAIGAYSSYLHLRTGTVAGARRPHLLQRDAASVLTFSAERARPARARDALVAGCYVGRPRRASLRYMDASSRPPLFGPVCGRRRDVRNVAHGAFGSS